MLVIRALDAYLSRDTDFLDRMVHIILPRIPILFSTTEARGNSPPSEKKVAEILDGATLSCSQELVTQSLESKCGTRTPSPRTIWSERAR